MKKSCQLRGWAAATTRDIYIFKPCNNQTNNYILLQQKQMLKAQTSGILRCREKQLTRSHLSAHEWRLCGIVEKILQMQSKYI